MEDKKLRASKNTWKGLKSKLNGTKEVQECMCGCVFCIILLWESVNMWLVSAGKGTGNIRARFENLAKQNEEEDKKRAQEERTRRQAKEQQEQEEARRKAEVRACPRNQMHL